MKVCVLGAGSLGSAIGGTLALAGNEVVLVSRKAHADAVNAHGLMLVSAQGERVAPCRACTDAVEAGGPFDLVIVLCKTYDTEGAIAGAQSLVGPDTVVVSLQNGLGAEDVLIDAFGAQRVIAGKTYIGGMLLEPGRVQATTQGKETMVGELDGALSGRVKTIAAMFESAGMPCVASGNITGVIWDKLLVNVSTGALCATTGLPYGDLYDEPAIRAVALKAVQEGIDVARAQGIGLRFSTPEESWELAREGIPGSFKPSLLQSLENGRRTEVDFIAGAVVREGAKVGIPTPVNETLTAVVHGIERRIQVR